MEMERNCRENSRSVSFSKIIAPASENDQLIMLVIVMIMVIMLMIVMIMVTMLMIVMIMVIRTKLDVTYSCSFHPQLVFTVYIVPRWHLWLNNDIVFSLSVFKYPSCWNPFFVADHYSSHRHCDHPKLHSLGVRSFAFQEVACSRGRRTPGHNMMIIGKYIDRRS